MLLLRHFSGITAPVIAGYHADIKWREQRQKFAAGFIRAWAKRISQNTACFGVVCVSEPVLPGFTADKAPLLMNHGSLAAANRGVAEYEPSEQPSRMSPHVTQPGTPESPHQNGERGSESRRQNQ